MIIGIVGLLPSPCPGLEAHEILVLANRNASHSIGLAKYYMERRGIPKDNLLVLWITDKEQCSREDYEKKVAGPVRRYLNEKDPSRHIRCILTMYGLPLKVVASRLSYHEGKALTKLNKEKRLVTSQLKDLEDTKSEQTSELRQNLKNIDKRILSLDKRDQGASMDSELALVLIDGYPLSKWIPNPYFVGYRSEEMAKKRDEVLIVSRLDGPSPDIVRRIIDDSIETEKAGLKGTAYFDARWPKPDKSRAKEKGMSYKFYDYSLHLAAEQVKKSGLMPVVVNDKPELFQPGDCPDAALYSGWYSLARYVDAFEWRRGAVGFHIASGECATLKQKPSRVWCKMMLEKGVAVTIGPVSEPYVQAFPIPELFFKFLLDGYWTLAECYALSQPFWSWQMVLIGDPLYRPFKIKDTGK